MKGKGHTQGQTAGLGCKIRGRSRVRGQDSKVRTIPRAACRVEIRARDMVRGRGQESKVRNQKSEVKSQGAGTESGVKGQGQDQGQSAR